ncbi:hypothetical protein [Neisseria chenwenguii]|uniref:Uncharacterized protein n=1 Tax=Neisseria chenwenguii TaxID=1853278 RepID=A0A220S2L7_9NEIS|nr:hypothetical protein [Neisseria chenwenguii]ASK27731.1 hypothetical protein BG910_08260 [Neisseria chenwenguii]ROV52401.1 hypothetical protein EGS38_11890 [Neisseria chenwenguii]
MLNYLVAYSSFLLKLSAILFFLLIPFYLTYTRNLRSSIKEEIGIYPSIKSAILWERVREDRKFNKQAKKAYLVGWLMRVFFFILWLVAITQIIKNDIQ